MMKQSAFLIAVALLIGAASGQVIVSEDFESYSNESALESVWRPDLGDGISPASGPIGILVPRTVAPFPPAPFDGTGDPGTFPPVEPLVGQAVTFSDQGGGIMEYDDDNNSSTVPFELVPTDTQAVRYSADIFDFVNGNRRFSVGLRNDTIDRDPGTFGFQAGLNFLELGYYNADAIDPTDPNEPPLELPTTGYAYRVALFGTPGGDLVRDPNWQYFNLPIEFDSLDVDHNNDGRFGNGDGLVTAADVGPGWHRFSATVTLTDVTVELDLFRDGTVDASQTWEIDMTVDPDNSSEIAPFTSLRMGGPSGIAMNEFTMVDNILLEMADLDGGGGNGDFDGDGDYACADIDALVTEIATGGSNAMFDLDGNGSVDLADVAAWLAEAGAAEIPSGNSYLPADANLDSVVDTTDFNVWNANKFTTTTGWCSGDFNADGVVDTGDFNVWNSNKFSAADSAAVPEPGGNLLLSLAGILLLVGRMRNRS